MSAIAGQTAGPNWLTFFEGTLEYPIKNSILLISRATPGTSASSKYIDNQ